MSSLWSIVLGLFSGVVKLFNKALDYVKSMELINQGKKLEQAENAKREAEFQRKTSEILTQERTKEETTKKLEDGTF